jgi:uncharacterized hydrophobic protein (TIGR00271 family)
MAEQGAKQRPVIDRVMPPQQRKGSLELADQLDLGTGDTASKQSAFWLMLVLAAAIATAGVIGNSTATVIGAMIIAPLATPIMAMALGIAGADVRVLRRGALFVAAGGLSVIVIGVIGSFALPSTVDLLANGQISSRTSPTLIDLVAAIATGFAGAIGLARRDVSDVLPGVAVAISLVPPLAVVGICLGQGSGDLALGALLLFASNVVAMVLAGTLVFAITYRTETDGHARLHRSGAALTAVTVLILIPLALNTVGNLLVSRWTDRIDRAAQDWLAGDADSDVLGVTVQSRTAVVEVLTPNDLPPVADLLSALEGQVPSGIKVVVKAASGRTLDAGTVQ